MGIVLSLVEKLNARDLQIVLYYLFGNCLELIIKIRFPQLIDNKIHLTYSMYNIYLLKEYPIII